VRTTFGTAAEGEVPMRPKLTTEQARELSDSKQTKPQTTPAWHRPGVARGTGPA
jgi:hypothetical protein